MNAIVSSHFLLFAVLNDACSDGISAQMLAPQLRQGALWNSNSAPELPGES
jgi:hypothetical protein